MAVAAGRLHRPGQLRPLDALERTRSVVDDAEAEALRSSTHGLSLLLEQPDELNGYLATLGRPLRPDVVLARYGAHLAVRPALEQAIASVPPGVRSHVWVSKVRLGLAQIDGKGVRSGRCSRLCRAASRTCPTGRSDWHSWTSRSTATMSVSPA